MKDPRDPMWRTKPEAGRALLFLFQAPPRLASLLPVNPSCLLSPGLRRSLPLKETATSLGMGSCSRKILWVLGFLLLLGTSSAQGTWGAMLRARLAEKSRVSAGRCGGASVVESSLGDTCPQMLWFLKGVGVSCM